MSSAVRRGDVGCNGEVKYEKIFLEEFGTVPQLLSGLKEYFEFYNFERPHQSLVGKRLQRFIGEEKLPKGSVNNTIKNKQKYTLTHERNCP